MTRTIPTVDEVDELPELAASRALTDLYLDGLRRAGLGSVADRTLADVQAESVAVARRSDVVARQVADRAATTEQLFAAATRGAHAGLVLPQVRAAGSTR